MGSIISGVGNAVGSIVGGIGGGVAQGAGATNQFQASNPYAGMLPEELANQQQIYGNQQNLAQALQAQLNGTGPNPAQTMFNANQQSNIANAQGLIASQRGLNPALAARMGANAATVGNQQASLGSALLQQQQQIAAANNLGNLYGQEQAGNLGVQQIGNQANLGGQQLNQQTGANNAQIRGQIAGGLLGAGGSIGAAAAGGGKAHGGKIEGAAKVKGDSKENDTVPAMLSPGEIVVPRSKAKDPKKAKEFIDHLMKSEGSDSEDEGGYGDILQHKRKVAELEKRIKSLEKKKKAA